MRRFIFSILMLSIWSGLAWAGASRDFDGANDNIDYGINVNNVNTFTWVLFVKHRSIQDGDVLINKGSATVGMKSLKQSTVASNSLRVLVSTDATSAQSITGANFINTTDLTFVFATYDNSGDRKARIYKSISSNNVSESSTYNTQTAATGTITNDSTGNFRIGENQVGTQDLDAIVGYFKIYNRVLSLVEMNEISRNPEVINNGVQILSPLLGDSPEIDLSGNGITGTVTGSTTSSDGPPVFLAQGLPL